MIKFLQQDDAQKRPNTPKWLHVQSKKNPRDANRSSKDRDKITEYPDKTPETTLSQSFRVMTNLTSHSASWHFPQHTVPSDLAKYNL